MAKVSEKEKAQLKEVEEKITPELDKKYRKSFEKEAQHLNGFYFWGNVQSRDTRELFVVGVGRKEGLFDKS